jgi:guanine deaminase
MRKIRTNILNPTNPDETILLKDHVISWEGSRITQVRPFEPSLDADCEDRRHELAVPGFIDIHVHLSQYRIRCLYEPSLLSWLKKHVYPAEALSRDEVYAQGIAEDFFRALFAHGTTTSVIYTAPYERACEIAFESAARLGARAMIGMTLMDQNSPAGLGQSTAYAFDKSVGLFQRFQGYSPLLSYIFTPRFALSCSSSLLEKVATFARDNSAWIQTHISENKDEVRQVVEQFGAQSYTQVYEQAGLLTPRTILAHAIHLSEKEMDTIKEYGCRIAHCPDSNFFLKSGEFNYKAMADREIPIGVGSDVAAGTNLGMLFHAKMVSYRQSSFPIMPQRLFYHVTLGNARALDMGELIGSLEQGKEADICLLGLPLKPIHDEDLVSALCFCGDEFPVGETIIAGKSVYRI